MKNKNKKKKEEKDQGGEWTPRDRYHRRFWNFKHWRGKKFIFSFFKKDSSTLPIFHSPKPPKRFGRLTILLHYSVRFTSCVNSSIHSSRKKNFFFSFRLSSIKFCDGSSVWMMDLSKMKFCRLWFFDLINYQGVV